ncbi:MAG: STAS domain-containing protein [Melioribacteraceae bacterium]|jgi:ABC-type transporter Mla MlaB component|nr:STAS domain-containing protein [Melioribacteraceae bacterium]
MFKTIAEKDSTKATLVLSGSVTVATSDELKNEVITLLQKFADLELVHENIENADLAYLQLLIACKKSAHTLGKKITVSYDNSEFMSELISLAGYADNEWLSVTQDRIKMGDK